jgi:hypothetical protein
MARQETTGKTMTLRGDRPNAVEAMFQFAYDKDIQAATETTSPDHVMLFIGLFEVADKYAYPQLVKEASKAFTVWLNNVLEHMANELHFKNMEPDKHMATEAHDQAVANFVQIAHAVCTAESEATNEAITGGLIKTILAKNLTSPWGPNRMLTKLIRDVSDEVPELGKDLYSSIMRRREEADGSLKNAQLGLQRKVGCKWCNKVWMLAEHNGEKGRCYRCGGVDEDWGPSGSEYEGADSDDDEKYLNM